MTLALPLMMMLRGCVTLPVPLDLESWEGRIPMVKVTIYKKAW